MRPCSPERRRPSTAPPGTALTAPPTPSGQYRGLPMAICGKHTCTQIRRAWSHAHYSAQNRRGRPFEGSSWTNYIKGIIQRYSGKTIVPSILRSSFVTYNEGTALPAGLKESIADSMRHRRSTVSEPLPCIHPILGRGTP